MSTQSLTPQPIEGVIVSQTPPNDDEIMVDKRGCKRYKRTGQLLKGQRLNPGGKPQTRFLSEALRQALETGDATVLANKLLNLAKKGRDNTALAAIQTIADRTEGKPLQAVAVQHSVDESTMRRIAELSERLLNST